MKNGAYWPYLIIALLVGGVLMNVGMVMRAANDPSFAVEDDYYQKAVDWDTEQAIARKSDALGWSLSIKPRFERNGEDVELIVEAELRDAFGRTIPDAELRVEALHLARANRRFTQIMDHNRGRFHAALATARPGQWEFNFEARRGEDLFLHQERAELSAEVMQ